MNVKVSTGVNAIKYIGKYVYKRSNLTRLTMGDGYNEAAMTVQGRYVSPAQAVWRILEYTSHQEKPAVMLLPFHLEG